MTSLDGSSGSVISADISSIDQLVEEKNALQSQNAQLWKLVDKQRTMIAGLQKDLDNARKTAQITQPSDAQLPYPTTPRKSEGLQSMPSAPHVIEDYDDTSSIHEQSPDYISPAGPRARRARTSPNQLDLRYLRSLENDGPPVKSPLRTSTNLRPKSRDEQTSNARNDGSSSPMSPGMSLRLQQVQRVVSPLSQSFPHASIGSRSTIDEIERVNMPRRERVRSSSAKSTSTLQSLDQQGVKSARIVRDGMLPASVESAGDHHEGREPDAVQHDSRVSPKTTVPSIAPELLTRSPSPENDNKQSADNHKLDSIVAASRTPLSASESGNTLADITLPYYSESSSFLPLTTSEDTERVRDIGTPKMTSQLAQEMSSDSDYGDAEGDAWGDDKTHTPKSPLTLEPAAEFFPTPVKHVWDEHSPERLRSGSLLSDQTNSPLYSETRSESESMSVSEATSIKLFLIDSGTSDILDIGVFSSDMNLINKLRKEYNELLDLQNRMPLQLDNTLPLRDEFDSGVAGIGTSRRAAIDLWFQKLQGRIQAEQNAQAATILSEFLSNEPLPRGKEFETETLAIDDSFVDRPNLAGSVSYKDLPIAPTIVRKEGYLKKRGKNFGGWKSRYFVLEGPTLQFFESKDGSWLGSIKLPSALVSRHQSHNDQTSNERENSVMQYALIIMEPKKRSTTSFVRHVLCASSEKECEEWAQSLSANTGTEETQADGRNRKESSKDSRLSIRNLSISSPTRGISYDTSQSSPYDSRLDSFAAIGYNDTVSRQQPLFDSQTAQSRATASISSAKTDSEVPSVSISRPMNGAPIDNNTAWGATNMSSPSMLSSVPVTTQPEKKAKKKSFWSFGKHNDISTAPSQKDLSTLHSGSMTDLSRVSQGRMTSTTGVFGISLSAAVQAAKDLGFTTGVPIVVSRCIDYLDLKHAEQEEGIYRLSGSNTVIRNMKERFNKEVDINLAGGDEYYDIHAIAGLLKLYLRELPSSILTQDLQRDFLDILEIPEGLTRTVTVRTLVHSLPRDNFELLKILSRHLCMIVSNSDINKMSLRNVGIVFSPTLNIPAAVFSLFIAEYEELFEVRDFDGLRTLSPPAVNADAMSIRSTRSNNPSASAVLDTEQSYTLFQQDQTIEPKGNPYGLSEFGSRHL